MPTLRVCTQPKMFLMLLEVLLHTPAFSEKCNSCPRLERLVLVSIFDQSNIAHPYTHTYIHNHTRTHTCTHTHRHTNTRTHSGADTSHLCFSFTPFTTYFVIIVVLAIAMLWYARNSTMILLFSVTIPSSVFFCAMRLGPQRDLVFFVARLCTCMLLSVCGQICSHVCK